MFNKTLLKDWEAVVQKQLKTDQIYNTLIKENIEGVTVKPFYQDVSNKLSNLPKVEESTHLVSVYDESAEENIFAFKIEQNVENLTEKAIFINNADLAEHIAPDESNRYFSLIDVFSEDRFARLDEQLGRELLEKQFERNLCIDISLHQNAGASVVQQLGIALAKTKELTEVFGKDVLAKTIFKVAVGSNYFFEIAKIRALKLVFNQFSKEFGENQVPYIYAETSLRNKSAHDPENNLIRSTLELSAAMIGGADAVFTNDYQLNSPTPLSSEISFKQQIVLAYESIINVFDDAANGSYYVEDLTGQFAERAWRLFLEIEDKGGYLENLKNGWVQGEIYKHALKEQQWVEEGKIKLIGVNLYPKLDKRKTAEEMYSQDEIRPVRLSEMFE